MGSYVQLGEARTYYEEDGDGPPLLLLHPGGADSRAFEVVVPGLAGHFRVFRPTGAATAAPPTSRARSATN
jgi:pimeloyl-ACP methyl ester carboxylesterase